MFKAKFSFKWTYFNEKYLLKIQEENINYFRNASKDICTFTDKY